MIAKKHKLGQIGFLASTFWGLHMTVQESLYHLNCLSLLFRAETPCTTSNNQSGCSVTQTSHLIVWTWTLHWPTKAGVCLIIISSVLSTILWSPAMECGDAIAHCPAATDWPHSLAAWWDRMLRNSPTAQHCFNGKNCHLLERTISGCKQRGAAVLSAPCVYLCQELVKWGDSWR